VGAHHGMRIFLAGATGVIGLRLVPLLVAAGLVEAVVAARPDAVLHQLTDLPDQPSSAAEVAAANARIRRAGTRNLLAAARAAGATRFLVDEAARRTVAALSAPSGTLRIVEDGGGGGR
jgi:nucleoside-diphosphate-sugar epimerase